jgi:hypothetical protein
MKIWERLSAWLYPRTTPLVADPVCVQDGSLRAYIWPARQQFSYEVVDALGEKLSVGAAGDLNGARRAALRLMRDIPR